MMMVIVLGLSERKSMRKLALVFMFILAYMFNLHKIENGKEIVYIPFLSYLTYYELYVLKWVIHTLKDRHYETINQIFSQIPSKRQIRPPPIINN